MNADMIAAYARESAAQAPPLTEQARQLLAVTLGTASAAPTRKARR